MTAKIIFVKEDGTFFNKDGALVNLEEDLNEIIKNGISQGFSVLIFNSDKVKEKVSKQLEESFFERIKAKEFFIKTMENEMNNFLKEEFADENAKIKISLES